MPISLNFDVHTYKYFNDLYTAYLIIQMRVYYLITQLLRLQNDRIRIHIVIIIIVKWDL